MPTTCPPYCAAVHDEQPGVIVHHHTPVIRIEQCVPGQPLDLFVSQYDFDMRPRLTVGGHDFDLPGAEQLLAELAVKVAHMRRLNAETELNLAVV